MTELSLSFFLKVSSGVIAFSSEGPETAKIEGHKNLVSPLQLKFRASNISGHAKLISFSE